MAITPQEAMKKELAKVYNETVIEHIFNPRNMGEIEAADGFGRITGPCGDTMEIWVKVQGETIVRAGFDTDGCGATVATGNMICDMVTGKTVSQAMTISQSDVLNALNGLPEENQHCALLASNTLKEALRNYQSFKKEPWKRAYNKH